MVHTALDKYHYISSYQWARIAVNHLFHFLSETDVMPFYFVGKLTHTSKCTTLHVTLVYFSLVSVLPAMLQSAHILVISLNIN